MSHMYVTFRNGFGFFFDLQIIITKAAIKSGKKW